MIITVSSIKIKNYHMPKSMRDKMFTKYHECKNISIFCTQNKNCPKNYSIFVSISGIIKTFNLMLNCKWFRPKQEKTYRKSNGNCMFTHKQVNILVWHWKCVCVCTYICIYSVYRPCVDWYFMSESNLYSWRVLIDYNLSEPSEWVSTFAYASAYIYTYIHS